MREVEWKYESKEEKYKYFLLLQKNLFSKDSSGYSGY